MKKRLFTLVLAAALMLSVAACTKNTDDSSGTATVTELTFCESWDFEVGFYTVGSPDTQQNYGALYWSANFYETLVNYENGKFVPGLAESWEISDDGTVYTFNLRQGVKFSDGSSFTSEAVKKSFEAAPVNLGQYNGSYGLLTTIFKEIVCVGEHTVELRLTQPYYGTLKDLTMLVPLAIVNPAKLDSDLKPSSSFQKASHGTGPYMYAGDGDGSSYTFVRNPHYWGEKPALDSFKVKVIPDNSAKLLALKSGEIDVIVGTDRLSNDGYSEIKGTAGFGATTSDTANSTRFVAFNMKYTGFDDLAVRDALSRAIDKDAICSNLLSGLETKADTIFPKSYPYCDVDVKTHAFDIDAAKKGLDDAGWKDTDGDGIREKGGVKLSGSLVYIAGNPIADELALAVAAQAKEIGIEFIPKGGDMMAYYADLYGDFGVALHYTYGLAYDPYTTVTNMNPESGADPVSMQALSLLPDPVGLIKTLNSTADENVICETYRTILTSINDSAIIIPISERKELAVYNTGKVKAFTFGPMPQYISISEVTLK